MSRNIGVQYKTPAEVLDYEIDWAPWLALEGDAIASATVGVPDSLTQPTEAEIGASSVTIWIGDGELGERYEVTCQITTDAAPARVAERTFTVVIA